MKSEPVLIMAAVQAAIALGVSFGLHLSPEQTGGIIALVGAIIAIFVRSQVSPAK